MRRDTSSRVYHHPNTLIHNIRTISIKQTQLNYRWLPAHSNGWLPALETNKTKQATANGIKRSAISPGALGVNDKTTVSAKPVRIEANTPIGFIRTPAKRTNKVGPNAAPRAIQANNTRLNIFSGMKIAIPLLKQ